MLSHPVDGPEFSQATDANPEAGGTRRSHAGAGGQGLRNPDGNIWPADVRTGTVGLPQIWPAEVTVQKKQARVA